MLRLGILSTHPIQYHSPWYRALARRPDVELTVLYCSEASPAEQARAGFGVAFRWDVDLLDGYRHVFLRNVSPRPDVSSFGGLVCRGFDAALEAGRFDAVVILGWYYAAAWQALEACVRQGIPALFRGDSTLMTQRSAARRLLRSAVYRNLFRLAHGGLPVGSLSRAYFLAMGFEPDRTRVVPYCVDAERFEACRAELAGSRATPRERFGIPPGAFTALLVGKLLPTKRPLDFLGALAIARDEGCVIHGLVVGDGPARPECVAAAREMGIEVSFAGFLNQSEIGEAYLAADALVLPSAETWGMVVNEAQLFGLPCLVGSEVGSGPDLVTATNAGAVFRIGEVRELASCLRKLAEDVALRAAMGERARESASKSTPERVAERTVRAIEALVREAPGLVED